MNSKNHKYGTLSIIILVIYFLFILFLDKLNINNSFLFFSKSSLPIYIANIFFPIVLIAIIILFIFANKHSLEGQKIQKTLSSISLALLVLLLLFFFFISDLYYDDSKVINYNNLFKEKLATTPDQPGTLIYTKILDISSDRLQSIASENISEKADISKDQVIFSTNGYNNDFQVSDNCSSKIEILSKDPVEYMFGFLCGDTKEDLEEYINNYNLTNINLNNFCGEANKRTCVVFPEK
jgi:hypothetical protein